MSLKLDSHPSSTAFDAISTSLATSPTDRADALKKANAIFTFNLTNSSGDTASWHIDLKKTGEVRKGEPGDGKSDVILSLSDEDFGKLVEGKTQAQRLFMSGRLKIQGDVMKATKMEPVLGRGRARAKL